MPFNANVLQCHSTHQTRKQDKWDSKRAEKKRRHAHSGIGREGAAKPEAPAEMKHGPVGEMAEDEKATKDEEFRTPWEGKHINNRHRDHKDANKTARVEHREQVLGKDVVRAQGARHRATVSHEGIVTARTQDGPEGAKRFGAKSQQP